MLASRAPPVESRGAVLAAPLPPPPQQPQPPPPTSQLPLHVPLHMPQLSAPFMAGHHPLLQYENLVRPVAAHRYDPGAAAAVDAADAVAAATTDRLFRESYFRRMRSDYEATAMFSPPDMQLWMAPTLPPPPAPPLHQTGHATHGVLRHPQARTSPPSSAASTRTPAGAARDSTAPVNLSAPHKAAQAGFSYPMLGTTSLYAPSFGHPSMVGRTAAVSGSTATYSPPAASPAPVPAMTPLGPPSAPPRRRAVPMSVASASMANLPPPAPLPPAAPAPPPAPPPAPAPVVAPPSTAASSSSAASQPADNGQSVSATPSPVTRDLTCFKRGALIQLPSGAVRCVENVRAEDLVTPADPTLHSYAAKVLKMTPKPNGAVAVSMSLRRTGDTSPHFESELEVPQEHPFLLFSQGWASYNPEKSLQVLGLSCQQLQIGQVCISLGKPLHSTPTANGSQTPFISAVPAPPSSRSASSSRQANRKNAQAAPAVQIPQSSGNNGTAASDAGSNGNNSSRKRRWSAPDQLDEENKSLKTTN